MTKRSIPEFFSSFPDFTPDPTAALTDEFSRLSLTRGWKTGSKNYKEQHNRFLLAEFDAHLGDIERGNKLERWQALCIELGAKEKFPSITKCKNFLKTAVHVNIVDLIESRRQDTRVKTFESRKALAAYTKQKNRYFPKRVAKKDVLLKILLRII